MPRARRLRALLDHELYVVRLVARTALKWDRDRSMRQAAALAFQTALAIVPAAAVALAWLDPATLADFLARYVLPAAEHGIATDLASFAARARVGAIGWALTFLTSWFLFNSIESVWSDVWDARERRALWMRLAVFVLLATAGAAALGTSVYYTARYWRAGGAGAHLWSLGFVWGALFLANRLLPRGRVRFEAAAVGAGVSALLFEAAKVGFSAFVGRILATRAEGLYGPLAVVFVLLVWVYWTWLVVLFGAKVAYAVHHDAG